MMETPTKVRYQELDALRGIACMLVIFFHFTIHKAEYNQIFKLGTTGVDLFFIISGFVILMSLQKTSKGMDFVINRVSRLYPAYWTAVTFTFVLRVIVRIYKDKLIITQALIEYIGNLTMFQFYLKIPDIDGPYWTMIIEMNFYILMLFLFKTNLLKYLTEIGIFICGIIVVITHYFYNIYFFKSLIDFLPLSLFFPLFFSGTVFYKIYKHKRNLVFHYFVIIFCFFCQLSLFPFAGKSNQFINWHEYTIMLSIYFLAFILFINLKLRFIVNPVTIFLGKISFSLYLIHQYISLAFIIPIFYGMLKVNFWIVCFLIDLPVVVLIATFITYKIEIPYSKLLKEKLNELYVALVNKNVYS